MTGEPTGLYIHVPFCDGKCRYCAFYSIAHDAVLARRWLAAVKREWSLYAANHSVPFLKTVYIGGGTPTLLDDETLGELVGWIRTLLPPEGAREWSVEANPGSVTSEKLRLLREAGVNRLSIGAQAFDEPRLRILGRRHSARAVPEAFAAARAAGFDNVGLDLIAGGPGCGPKAWRHSLEQAVALEPDHVSVYALTVEEGTALARAVRMRSTRISEAAVLGRLHEAQALLETAGFERYEISNYARPGLGCLHNIACWRGERYLGLGPAAASHVGLARWTNAPDVRDYIEWLEAGREPLRDSEELSLSTKAVERVVFGLRMTEGVELQEALEEGGPAELAARWEASLAAFSRQGWTEKQGRRWKLTRPGLDFADAVAVELM
ncbi:MAG: radical SAM family heme chaperone HemW [Kiritimatiellia bacterium]